MRIPLSRRLRPAAILFAAISPTILAPSMAGTLWDGGGVNNNWTTGANWNPDGAPLPGQTTDLTFDGSIRITPFNDFAAFEDFRNLIFAPTAGQFTLLGNSVDLFGKIENYSSQLQTVALTDIALVAGQPGTGEFNPVNGDLLIQSANIYTNGNAIHIYGAANKTVTFGAGTVISQGGQFIIEQANTVVFQSAHSYTGDTVINAGALSLSFAGSANSSTIRLGGAGPNSGTASLILQELAGGQSIASTLVVRPSSSGTQGIRSIQSQNTSGTNTLSGSIYLDAALSTQSTSGGTLAFSGTVLDLKNQTLTVTGDGTTSITNSVENSTGNGSIVKQGSGTLVLSAANSFSGPLTVEGGTLSIPHWNNSGSNGPLGNSALPLTLGSPTSMGTLRYTGGGSNNAPATIKPLSLAPGGGKVEMVYNFGDRNGNYIHINGDRITGSGGLTVDTLAGGADSRFIIIGSAPYTGPTSVAPGGELQTNYSTIGVDGTPFGAGLNGLGSPVTLANNARLTFFSFGVSATVAIGSLSGAGIVQGEGGGIHTFKIGGDNSSTTFSGTIQNNGGPVAITKVGSGTLTLAGNNTHSGITSIEGGAITVPSWNQSGQPGPWGSVNNNAASPTTSFIQMAGGRINYAGPNADGALRGVNLVSGNNTIDVTGGSALNFAGGSNTFQSNGGNLIKEGTGTLQIGTFNVANNVFTGKVTINAGALDWFGAGSMPTPANVVPDFITINNGGSFQLNYPDVPTTVPANIGFHVSGSAGIGVTGTHTIPGVIADGAASGGVTKTGTGTLTLSGVNTYSGPVAVEEGILNTADWTNKGVAGALGSSVLPITLGGAGTTGTLRYAGPAFLPDNGKKGLVVNPGGGKIVLAMGPDRNSYAHLNGSEITGTGGLTIQTGGARFIIIESAAYTGPTVVEDGSELQTNYSGAGDGTPFGAGLNGLGSSVFVGAGSALTFYSYNAQAGPVAIGSLSGSGTVRGEGSGIHTFKVGGNGTNSVFSGVIADSFNAPAPSALIKVGTGTLTLSGANTYTGTTEILGGTLLVDGSISGSSLNVISGTLGGTNGTVGATIVNATGILSPGASIGTLNFNSTLALLGSSEFEIHKSGMTLSSDFANVVGLLTLGGDLNVTATGDSLVPGDSFDLFDAGSVTGSFTSIDLPPLQPGYAWDDSNLESDGVITVVPEPVSLFLLLGGMGALATRRRRA